MPQLQITIGGRAFEVACEAGQEPVLQAAVATLDKQAELMRSELGRLTETRMLLMAGLMLADKMVNLEQDSKSGAAELQSSASQQIEALNQKLAEVEKDRDAHKSMLLRAQDVLTDSDAKVTAAQQERDQAINTLENLVSKSEAIAQA